MENGKFKIEWIKVNKINPAPYNPRKDLTPDDLEYQKIKKSINEFGLVDPLIINDDLTLIGGHQRLKVLVDAGFKSVPCSIISLDKKKEKALNIALNKITGEWDFPKLTELLTELDYGAFDMETIGFDDRELEKIFTYSGTEESSNADPDDKKKSIRRDCENGILFSIGFCDILIARDQTEFDCLYSVFGKKYDYPEEIKAKLLQCVLDEISKWPKSQKH